MFSDHLPEYFLKLAKWNSSMPSAPLPHTAHTYYSSPWHDFYIQSTQKRSNPSLYISLAWVRNNVFTMNEISFSKIIYIYMYKRLRSLENWDDASVLVSRHHLRWRRRKRKITVLLFQICLPVKLVWKGVFGGDLWLLSWTAWTHVFSL